MKGFILAFLLSTTLMFGIVYTTILNPSLFTNVIDSSPEETTTETPEITEEETPNTSFMERLEKGDALFEATHYDLAAVEYQAATQLDPAQSEGFYKLGQAAFYSGDFAVAENALTQALALNPQDPDTQWMLGKTFLELEAFDQAQAQFEAASSTDVRIVYYRGVLHAYNGHYPEAQVLFQQVIDGKQSPELSTNATIYLNSMTEFDLAQDAPESYQKTLVGRSLAETGENTLATALLYDVLRIEPDYRDAWIILGYVYLSKEQYAEAQEALLKAVEIDPSKGETRYFLGLSYFGQDDMGSAIPQFELALESGFEPKVQVYQKLGDAAVLTGDYPKAVDAYENVLVLNSSDVNLYIRPIWLYLDHLNDTDRALELAETALAEHPNDAMSYNLVGWVQTAQKEYAEAEKNLNYALILNPELPAIYLNFGRWHEAQEQWEEAKEYYKRAYAKDPEGSIGSLAAERYNTLVAQTEAETTVDAPTESPVSVPSL